MNSFQYKNIKIINCWTGDRGNKTHLHKIWKFSIYCHLHYDIERGDWKITRWLLKLSVRINYVYIQRRQITNKSICPTSCLLSYKSIDYVARNAVHRTILLNKRNHVYSQRDTTFAFKFWLTQAIHSFPNIRKYRTLFTA